MKISATDQTRPVLFFFLLTVSGFISSARFSVTEAVFVLNFHNSSISFFSIIKSTDVSVTARDWPVSSIKLIRSELSSLTVKHGSLFSFGVSSLKKALEEEGKMNENRKISQKSYKSNSKERKCLPKHRCNFLGLLAMLWAT